MDVAQLVVIAVGIALVGLGIYGAMPYLAARRRSRQAALLNPPRHVYNVGEAFPLLRQDLHGAPAAEAAPAASVATAPRSPLPPVVDEVAILTREVDVLRRQIGAMRDLRRATRRKPRLPGTVMPSSLQKRLVEMRRQTRDGGLALAGPSTGRIRPRRVA
jgi:hypothetical protein